MSSVSSAWPVSFVVDAGQKEAVGFARWGGTEVGEGGGAVVAGEAPVSCEAGLDEGLRIDLIRAC
jgi:hypothetical protein